MEVLLTHLLLPSFLQPYTAQERQGMHDAAVANTRMRQEQLQQVIDPFDSKGNSLWGEVAMRGRDLLEAQLASAGVDVDHIHTFETIYMPKQKLPELVEALKSFYVDPTLSDTAGGTTLYLPERNIIYYDNSYLQEPQLAGALEELFHSSGKAVFRYHPGNNHKFKGPELIRAGYITAKDKREHGHVLEEALAKYWSAHCLKELESRSPESNSYDGTNLHFLGDERERLVHQWQQSRSVDAHGRLILTQTYLGDISVEPEFWDLMYSPVENDFSFVICGGEDAASGGMGGSLIHALLAGYEEGERQYVYNLLLRGRIYTRSIGELQQVIDKRYGKGAFLHILDTPAKLSEVYALTLHFRQAAGIA